MIRPPSKPGALARAVRILPVPAVAIVETAFFLVIISAAVRDGW